MTQLDLTAAQWRTSSYSSGQGQCIEVAMITGRGVATRDSKDPRGPVLVFAPDAWTAFVVAATGGDLDGPG